MRIAFTGAAGTGKTTLATHIAEKYGWPLNPVGSRSVAEKMGFSSPYDVDAAGKRVEFQQRLLEEKLEWEDKHEHFVTDRTYLDNLLYSSMHGAADSIDLNAYVGGLRRYYPTFYCTIDSFHNVGTDPARVRSNNDYHRIYDIFLQGLIAHYAVSHYVVDKTGLEIRKAFVESIIERLQHRRR